MPSLWDHRADVDLLLAIIESGVHDWQAVSAVLTSKGHQFTHEACRQHYQKIRKGAKNNATMNSFPPNTPTKAKAPGKNTPNGKNPKGASFREDDPEDINPTPTKRKRTDTVKKESKLEQKVIDVDNLDDFAGKMAQQFKTEQCDEDGLKLEISIDDNDDDNTYA